MQQLDLSIIIVNYNTFDLTATCIDSIYTSKTTHTYEIILVDNASTERNPLDFCQKYPKLILIQNKENQGFGRANNTGMEKAKGEHILLLNSDTELSETVLEKALTTLKKEQADLYSCAQFLEDGSPFIYKKNSFYLGLSLRTVIYGLPLFHLAYFYSKFIKDEPVKELIPVKTVSGAFMLLRKAVYEETQGFDPDFFLYAEETEWCYNRIRKKFKLIYDPSNSFIHKQGGSANQNMSLQQYVSTSLGYYKMGYGIYLIYLLLQYLVALPLNLVFFLISKKKYKAAYSNRMKILIKGCRYLLLDIPRWPNKFGARKFFLKVDNLK